ncbi:polycystin-1 [Tachysurus fulvidraco]|uniref:polycystin-1 n=1 Tax=Tachysurus fulvidraco TaxID=1234273 RepID=UPI001FEE74AF|nr:polycystin-1 [Tachysurus fulvidraco]
MDLVHLSLVLILSTVTRSSSGGDFCPKGAQIDRDGSRCYWMPESRLTWQDTRDNCLKVNGGDLAVVDKPSVQTFIVNSFRLEASGLVWLRNGLTSPFGAVNPNHEDRERETCPQMSLRSGQWKRSPCNQKHHFICGKQISVSLPSLDSYVIGVPLMSAVYTQTQLHALPSPPDLEQRRAEMMLFPGLWVSHGGQVLSVELVAQPSQQLTMAKVQILRPYCSPNHHLVPPGCSSILNPFTCCSLKPLCNTTGGCPSRQYWCHLVESCLLVTSPCSPYHSSADGQVFSLPPRYTAVTPFYHMVADIALEIPRASEPVHINVMFKGKEFPVFPDDILAVQHTRKSGEFLHCSSVSDSAWSQSYISILGPDWGGWVNVAVSALTDGGHWVDNVSCDLRLIYADPGHLYGPYSVVNSTQRETGIDPNIPGDVRFDFQTPVTGLQVLYPVLDNENQIDLASDIQTLIIIKILSGRNATSSWSAPVSRAGVPFLKSCPEEISEFRPLCQRDSRDTWFSYAYLMPTRQGEQTLNITASNQLNSQTLSVKIQAHVIITGLRIQPQGFHRVLVDIPQLFTAAVATGSSVMYTWVIDNRAHSAHIGEAYSVAFTKPAEHTLRVTAENPVSSQFTEVKLTADVMSPLAELTFLSTTEAVAVNTSIVYGVRVKLDVSIGVTIRWDFGDHSSCVNHTSVAPLERKNDVQPDQTATQIYLQDNAHHIYTTPGDYTLRIQAQNKYDFIQTAVLLKVRSPLTKVLVSSKPALPKVNQTILFETSSQPSSYGIVYMWNFGDGSSEVEGPHRITRHVFKKAGVFNVSVFSDNTLSKLNSWTIVEVFETISGVHLRYNGPSELGSITEISGSVSTGTDLRWTFDLGDGTVFKDLEKNSVSYVYRFVGNYTVQVTTWNAVSSVRHSINVDIYQPAVTGILPLDCVVSGKEVNLQALVRGNVSQLTFHWSFGDSTVMSVKKGTPSVAHTFSGTGSYLIDLTIYSQAGSAHYQTNLCVQSLITDMNLHSSLNIAAVGEEICFDVSVLPTGGESYQFLWFNSSSCDCPVNGTSHHCFVFTQEGQHEIMVITQNQVSKKTASTKVFVNRPISKMSVQHNGDMEVLTINHSYFFWTEPRQNGVEIEWDFGDGLSKYGGRNVSHAFTSAGQYHVSALVFNAVIKEIVGVDVDVQVPISDVVIHANQLFTEALQEAVFTASSNVMDDNVKFYWSVDSLTDSHLGSSEYKCVFPKAGIFHVRVLVQNSVSKLETSTTIEVLERIQDVQITSQILQSTSCFPTNETITLNASVKRGTSLAYQWLVHQDGCNDIIGVGKQFNFFTNHAGNVSVKLIVSNIFGKVYSNVTLRAVERISGVNISALNVIAKGKPVKIAVTLKTGTDLHYIWFLDTDRVPMTTDVPFIQHIFNAVDVFTLRVSIGNVLGSVNGTKQFTVQEPVSEIDFEVNGRLNPFVVASSSLLNFHGSVRKGTDLRWEWTAIFWKGTEIVLGNNRTFSYSFMDAGDHRVTLNVSNEISWQAVSHVVTVQDAIKGLSLRVSDAVICENDPVTFTPSITQGSGVLFTLEFPGRNTNLKDQEDFTTSSIPVGNHTIRAVATNLVSALSVNVTVKVVERVTGLHLVNCCSSVFEASKPVSFKASVKTGSKVTYRWNFNLDGFKTLQQIGQSVQYFPVGSGSMSVTVEAMTDFCSQSLTETVQVQQPVKNVKLSILPDAPFVDHEVTFLAHVDGGSDLLYKWNFSDDTNGNRVTNSNKESYKYNVEGRFMVQVTVFNNISQVSAQFPVLVRKLECTLPRLTLIQEHAKVLKSRENYFEASVDLNDCASYKTNYLWEIFMDPDCMERKVILNGLVDVKTPLLTLPKHTLEVGDYCLKFTTRFEGTPLQHYKTTGFSVVNSPLVPLIKGGSFQIWSNQKDLILDGTESYDPDATVQQVDLLEFRWDVTVEQNASAPQSPASSLNNYPIQYNSSKLILPRHLLEPESVYHFTLTMQKHGRSPVSTVQQVQVHEAEVLPVTVKCVSCRLVFSSSVSYSYPLVLSGCCPRCNGTLQYNWTAENTKGEVLLLNEVTTPTGHSSTDLVVRPNVLKPGLKYIFRLNVSQPSTGLWGSASIDLTQNRPPKAGICTLSPEDSVRLLQNVVSFNCSGWMDENNNSAQLIYTFQVAQCENPGPQCPLITLYRGTQNKHGTLVPLGNTRPGRNASVITVMVTIEDKMGAKVTAIKRNLMVIAPVSDHNKTEWLKKKSQEKLWALLKQGNPQDVIPYATALTSQLNQLNATSMQEFKDKVQMRGNVTQVLASLSVSSLQDAAQISSALAHSTAIPSEMQCGECTSRVLAALGKMINLIRKQTRQGDVTPIDTGRNILNVLSSSMSVQNPANASGLFSTQHQDTAMSAFYQVGQLMRSLMWSQMPGEEALDLKSPQISAVGKRGDPTLDLLCSEPSSLCHFQIPLNLSSRLRTEREDVVQILLVMESEELPFISTADPPISTMLAAMEFSTPQGLLIPIANLTAESAIRVMLQNKKTDVSGRVNVTLVSEGSVNFTVRAVETEPNAGIFIAFNFSLIQGSGKFSSGKVSIIITDKQTSQPSQLFYVKELTFNFSSMSPSVEETVFLTPILNGSAKDLYVTLKNSMGVDIGVSVCVFSSLCQFFSMEQRRWSTAGLSVLSTTSPDTAHCLTEHLTLFGASLFVHPDSIVLLAPSDGPSRNILVGLVCGVLLLIHLLVGLIAHKIDHLESTRLSCIPLCGQSGRHRYRVLVKTGWYRGAGTTAHVGISLHGLNKSGSRHLQREGAFQRNGLDDFQVETEVSLGEIWKICIWHDNTGLDPSWYLQHVTVWDLQTDNMFFFMVEDWLSVENEKNSGLVQKVVLATCPPELRQFKRILQSQLIYGLQDHHLWLSLWERPAHSVFSRAQRVTCCALILHLYLAAGAVWYGSVATTNSGGPVAERMLMTPETVMVGMTITVLMFPLQTLLSFLFRKTKSKVDMEISLPPSPMSDIVEMEVYLHHPDMSCASFLSMPTGHESSTNEGFSLESSESLNLESEFWNASQFGSESRLDQWTSIDSIIGFAEMMEPSRLLKRKRALLKLRLNSPASQLSTSEHSDSPDLKKQQTSCSDPFSSSEASSGPSMSDSGRYSPNETVLSDTLDGSSSEWMDVSVEKSDCDAGLYKSHCSMSVCSVASTFLPSLPPDSFSTTSTTHIGVSRSGPGLMLPAWMLGLAYLFVAVLLGTCLALVGLYGSSFSNSVLLMWLTSVLSAFFTSVLVLEPLMICIRAMYLALVVKPVDPEVEDRLAQESIVMRVWKDQGVKVRPLCGYGLLHAKEEARKVRILRNLMKNCLIYMLFLLVVLMMNYQDNIQETNGRLLHSAVKRSIVSAPPGQPNLTALSGWSDVWQWMEQRLTTHLHRNPTLSLIGIARLQRVNTKDTMKNSQTFMMVSAETSGHLRQRPQSNRTISFFTWPWPTPQSCVSSETDEMLLGNSSFFTSHILSDLKQTQWFTAETRAVLVEFTQYHRETGIFLPVSILLEKTQTQKILCTVSIHSFHIPGSFSGPELNIAITALLLIFSLCFLSAEVRRMLRERAQYLTQGWHLFQLLVALLSFSAASLHFCFLSMATMCLSGQVSKPDTFTGFHSIASLSKISSQLSAVLLMLLVLQMAGSLQFVRRWVVFSRVLHQACSEIFGVVLLFVLLLLLFSHTGSLLFSASVEGFRSVKQASQTLLCLLRDRIVVRQMSEKHPVLGPLFCLTVFGLGFWLLGHLCGAVLLHRYKTIRKEMYRPSLEPQDYEMVEFLIKRLKLWMGLSKIKEFRHRVKFEGMESPPSRSSQCSHFSNIRTPISPTGPCLVSSASSQVSESSTVSESLEVQQYLDRLLPSVESLLAGFDRVNRLNDDVLNIEEQLQKVQRRIAQNRRTKIKPGPEMPSTTKLEIPSQTSLCIGLKPLQPFLVGISEVFPSRRATHSESSILGPSAHLTTDLSVAGRWKSQTADPEIRGFPRRRAWHSGTCHSADTIQRFSKSQSPGAILLRPRSEERDWSEANEGMPIKKKAWHSDPSEIEKD